MTLQEHIAKVEAARESILVVARELDKLGVLHLDFGCQVCGGNAHAIGAVANASYDSLMDLAMEDAYDENVQFDREAAAKADQARRAAMTPKQLRAEDRAKRKSAGVGTMHRLLMNARFKLRVRRKLRKRGGNVSPAQMLDIMQSCLLPDEKLDIPYLWRSPDPGVDKRSMYAVLDSAKVVPNMLGYSLCGSQLTGDYIKEHGR